MLFDELDRAVKAKDIQSLSNIIKHRLAGYDFENPIVLNTGESYSDLLIEYYLSYVSKSSKRIDFWNKAFANLLVEIKIDIIGDFDETLEQKYLWLSELMLVGRMTNVRNMHLNRDFVLIYNILSSKISDNNEFIKEILTEGFGLLTQFDGSPNSYLHGFIAFVLSDSRLAFDCASELAHNRPQILAKHLDIYVDNFTIRTNRWDLFTEVVRLCLVNVSNHKDVFDQLKQLVSRYADKSSNMHIRRSIVKAITLSDAKFDYLRKIEKAFWDSIDPEDFLTVSTITKSRTALKEEVRKQLGGKVPNLLVRPLRINSLPYAEAAYLRLFQILIELYYGIDVRVIITPFEVVGNDLLEGNIDLAFHNESIKKQIDDQAINGILRSNGSAFSFTKYNLLASKKCLYNIVASTTVPLNIKDYASRILNGESGNMDSIQLFELIKYTGITFLRNTDTESCFRHFVIEKVDKGYDFTDIDKYARNLDPDDGLESLIDGNIGFYIGGALQSNYAMTFISEQVECVRMLEYTLEEYFYVSSERYKDHVDFYNQLLRIWTYVSKLWVYIQNPKFVPRKLDDLIPYLKADVINTINRSRDIPNGYIESFEQLSDVLSTHDMLRTFDETKSMFVEVAREQHESILIPLNNGREKRKNEKRAG